MGLDMYLEKNIYVGANYEHRNVKGVIELTQDINPIPINLSRVNYIIERVGYWRKANAIHKWFVDNCGGGEDECQRMYITDDNLNELLALCKEVKANPSKAGELLPTEGGFFFGSTDYDEWYFEDIDNTIAILEAVLAEIATEDAQNPFNCAEYYYQASW